MAHDTTIEAIRRELARLGVAEQAHPSPGDASKARIAGAWFHGDYPAAECLERLRMIPWPLRPMPTGQPAELRDHFWHGGGFWALLSGIEHPEPHRWVLDYLLPEGSDPEAERERDS